MALQMSRGHRSHGFLFVEFDTSSSVICHVSLVRFLLAHFYMHENDDCSHLIFAMY